MESFMDVLAPFLMTLITALFGTITVRINKKQKAMEADLTRQSNLRRKERAVNKEIAAKIKIKDEVIEQLIVVNSKMIIEIAKNTSGTGDVCKITETEFNKLNDKYKEVMADINVLLIKRDTIDSIQDGTHKEE